MNREFSKGMVLYLTEHARVQSTFGGHYDLAAYLVIVLPIFYLLAINAKKKWPRLALHSVHLLGLWLLIMSASRTSFIAYLGAVMAGLLLLAFKPSKFWHKVFFFVRQSLTSLFLVALMMLVFGADMRERLEQVLQAYPSVFKVYQESENFLSKQAEFFNDPLAKIRDWQAKMKPSNGIAFDNTQLDSVLTPTDQQPVSQRPVDVYADIPDKVAVSTQSSQGETITTYVEKPRTWSANALKYGLSFAIRLDELWPNALKGFAKNPLLGSGYATLNKKEFQQFTEAESTDNNFLRTLGETGLLGFITFYGSIIILLVVLYRNQKTSTDQQLQVANIAFIAASIGLLLNASYIDVFASSKVAFTYWALAGAILAYNNLTVTKNVKKTKKST
jgi:O-antigen ligase